MIPLLFGVPAAASAVYGLYKSGQAVVDHSEASSANQDAKSLVQKATKLVDEQRGEAYRALEDYGSRKLRSFNGPIADFIEAFGQLKNVDEIRTPELDNLQVGEFGGASLDGLKQDYELLLESGIGLGAGMSGGAALAFGAYNGTMMLATASTGTAISTLSGAAATNATLAWLGGGSVVAGGGGIAVGTAVLGGVIAGPALAIFGHFIGNKAQVALADAYGNQEKARTCWEDAQKVCKGLDNIEFVTLLANKTFSGITGHLRRAVRDMREVIERSGNDYQAFSSDERAVIFRAVKFAQLIKAMIDTPILDAEGNLVLASAKRVQELSDLAEGRVPDDTDPLASRAETSADDNLQGEERPIISIPAPMM